MQKFVSRFLLVLIIFSAKNSVAESLKPVKLYGSEDVSRMSLEMKKQHNARVINDIYEMFLVDLMMKVDNKNDQETLKKYLIPVKLDCVNLSKDYEIMLSQKYVGSEGARKFYEDATDGLYKKCYQIVSEALKKNSNLVKYLPLIKNSLPLEEVLTFQSNANAIKTLKKLNPDNMFAVYSFKALNSMNNLNAVKQPVKKIGVTPEDKFSNLSLSLIVALVIGVLAILFIKLRG